MKFLDFKMQTLGQVPELWPNVSLNRRERFVVNSAPFTAIQYFFRRFRTSRFASWHVANE